MKRFIIKIMLISLAVLVMFTLLNQVFINSDYFRTEYADWTRFNEVPDKIEIANTGTSHGAAGFDYSDTGGINGFNFALAGQTFDYDLQMLRQHIGNFDENAVLMIPVSYISFSDIGEERVRKQNTRYYRILEPKYILDFSISDYFLYKLFPVLTVDTEIIYIFRKPSVPASQRSEGRTFADYTPDEVRTAIENNKSQFFNIYSYDPDSLGNLCSLVEFALEKGLAPVLVTLPVTDAYAAACPAYIKEIFHDNIALVTQKYGIGHMDYGLSEEFSYDFSLFADSNHLNSTGARLFTGKILQQLGISDR